MASYSIGDVEKLTGLKAHVLRYWEKEIPLLQPKKDHFGRRIYSSRDLRIIMRLKHLLHVRRFTIMGAREQLAAELSGEQDLRAHIDAVRSDLIDLYFTVHKPGQPDPGEAP